MMAKTPGAKDLVIDHDQLRKLMSFKPTAADVAGFFKCSRMSIHNYIRTHFDQTFLEFREENMYQVKLNLITKARKMAEAGNTEMLKFCLVNLAKWSNGFAKNNFDEDADSELEFVYEDQ